MVDLNDEDVPLAAFPFDTISYTVAVGDSLWSIAQKFYGSGAEWFGIYDRNADIIGPVPGDIQVGMVLAIPIR